MNVQLGYKQRRMKTKDASPSAITMVQTPQCLGDRARLCRASTSGSQNEEVEDNGGSCFGFGAMGTGMDGKAITNRPSVDENGDPMTLIAKELNRLSVKERDEAYEDLHGVSATVRETPELITHKLLKMEEQLHSIQTKPAYNMAKTIQEDYVNDPKLRIIFLRADRFDAEKAAKRFVGWLDWKLKLFGREKLCKAHIGLDDLDEDARFAMEAGLYHVLPARDSRGRVVLVLAGQYRHRFFRTLQSGLQMSFYLHMCLAEDENNQKSGAVYIMYCIGKELKGDARNPESPFDLWSSMNFSSLAACCPIRSEAMHYLTSDKGLVASGFSFVASSLTQKLKARLRVHVGSHLECEYALLSFGLPSSFLPFTAEGELKPGNHKKWIQRRIVKDTAVRQCGTNSPLLGSMTKIFSGIELPSRSDVLMGQGKPIRNHPGNQRLAEILQEYYEEYNQTTKIGGRVDVARKILHQIQKPSDTSSNLIFGGGGCRFLKRRDDKTTSGWWEEVTDEDVLLEKLCNGLRDVRKRKSTR